MINYSYKRTKFNITSTTEEISKTPPWLENV